MCSTDDRYADDVHYVGGCVLGVDMLPWAATMLALCALPPDPAAVGDGWRATWLERLERTTPMVEAWLSHQRRDEYWRHGSVCEDYAAIEAPVYAVGGWADGYTQRRPAPARGPARTPQGPDRPVVAHVPAGRRAGAGDRLPAGVRALVRPAS